MKKTNPKKASRNGAGRNDVVDGVRTPAAVNPVGEDGDEVEGRMLMPPSGKFKNSGIWLPNEIGFWTFKSDEFSLAKVASSLRSILETGDGCQSSNSEDRE